MLGDTIARVLAGSASRDLVLDGLTTLDADTASALATIKGGLFYRRVRRLSPDAAKSLAELSGESLGLIGLDSIHTATAEVLGEFKGPRLSVN